MSFEKAGREIVVVRFPVRVKATNAARRRHSLNGYALRRDVIPSSVGDGNGPAQSVAARAEVVVEPAAQAIEPERIVEVAVPGERRARRVALDQTRAQRTIVARRVVRVRRVAAIVRAGVIRRRTRVVRRARFFRVVLAAEGHSSRQGESTEENTRVSRRGRDVGEGGERPTTITFTVTY